MIRDLVSVVGMLSKVKIKSTRHQIIRRVINSNGKWLPYFPVMENKAKNCALQE
jgi:hypothetical protein